MDERGRPQGLGRLLLKALAIASGLTFLAIVMVNACATYAAPTKAAPVVSPARGQPAAAPEPPPEIRDLMPPTKAAPVVPPRPLVAPASKSAAVVQPRPLMQLPPDETPQQQAPPPQQAAPQQRGGR